MALTNGRTYKSEDQNNFFLTVPVANGQTVYPGAFAAVRSSDGYVINAAANANMALVGLVQHDSMVNSSGMTATANGSLTAQTNTVNLQVEGVVEYTFDSISQANVGQLVYVKDNGTLTINPASGIYPIGTLVAYKSSTKGTVRLNWYKTDAGGTYVKAIAGGASTAANIFYWKNPEGASVVVKDLWVRVTTAASSAVTADFGTGASSTSASDKLVDGATLGTAGLYSALGAGHGTNGYGNQLLKSTEYVVGRSANKVGSAMVGWVRVFYERI